MNINSSFKNVLEIVDQTIFLGLHATAGLVSHQDDISDQDATVITLMKNAGAILLGVTNVPEALMWFDSSNKIYGRTRSPYNTSRISGGSSGE